MKSSKKSGILHLKMEGVLKNIMTKALIIQNHLYLCTPNSLELLDKIL